MKQPVNDYIRYANCWEDPEMLLGACDLHGKSCLSIASGGDNSFSLLTTGASRVVGFDLNEAQLALCELKTHAFAELNYETFLAFLGFTPASSRWEIYQQKIAPHMSQTFFDRHPEKIVNGVINGGKFESYFQCFSRWILPLAHTQKRIDALLSFQSQETQFRFYYEKWNNLRFNGLYKLFFNRWVMGLLGRDKHFFNEVKRSFIASELKSRTDYALSFLPAHDNPFLHYILRGSFGKTLPHYAQKENFEVIKANLNKITWVQGSLDSFRGESFDFLNLSDIFEYQTLSDFQNAAEVVCHCAAENALVAYYNMLLPRTLSGILPLRFVARDTTALFSQNRAFFYGAFHLEAVQKGGGK